jgi:hypothetical protein
MDNIAEFISRLCKSRNEGIVGERYYSDTNYGNMVIAVSRLSDKDVEDDTIELEDENFMYIKIALIRKVLLD